MKAAVVHDFTQPLSIEDVPTLEAGDGQVLVRIDACGLSATATFRRKSGSGTRRPGSRATAQRSRDK
jgi:Zn-dependent alcohol dehydrogenase